jgi:DNA-binding transcriptional LysR family regulator
VERHEIETFLTMARELHFGRSAEHLGVSQARVSQTIKKLERRIGAPLFVRTTRRVSLTVIGQQLQADLEPAYQGIEDAYTRAVAAARGMTGHLRVGFMGPVAGELIIAVTKIFRARHPGCEVQIRETQIADPCEPLRTGEVDLLLTQLPVDEPGITAGAVAIREPRMLAVAATHPFARRKGISMEDLARVTFFLPAGTPSKDWMESTQPWQTPSGKPIRRGLPVTTFQELLTLIAGGHGASTVAAHNVRFHPHPDVAYVPIHDAPPFEFGFVWQTSGETGRVRAFAQATDEYVQTRGGPTLIAEPPQPAQARTARSHHPTATRESAGTQQVSAEGRQRAATDR